MNMEELYNKLLFVSLRSSSREERRVRLRITVGVRCQQARGKELHVRLTDDEDPFFLFTLQLGEDDFQSLKSHQGLLVDFGAFPQNLIDLLSLCLQEEAKDLPKFLLTFTISDHDCGVSHLNVIETNSFKHLTHLSLKFLLGNDVDVKKYLAGCLTSLKEENRLLKHTLQTTETELNTRLTRSQEALAARNKELSSFREEFSNKSSSLINKHTQELSTEREKTLQVQNSCQKRFEEEKRELESSHKSIVNELQSKLSKLSMTNGELNEGKLRSESCVRHLKNKIGLLEKDGQRCKIELTNLRRENATLDVERHERDKTLNHLRTRIAVLEQEVKDNQEVITRTKELLEVANEQKRKGDEALAERQQQFNKSEKTVKSISEELMKGAAFTWSALVREKEDDSNDFDCDDSEDVDLDEEDLYFAGYDEVSVFEYDRSRFLEPFDDGNEIILRFQKDLRNAKTKNKMNATVLTQQEKVIAEKNTIFEKQNTEISKMQSDIKNKDAEIKTLTEALETASEKLEESKQLLKTNENVINWLNKQMNEQCITQSKFGAAPHSATSNTGFRSGFSSNVGLPHSTPLSQDSGIHSGYSYVPRYTSQPQVVYRPGQKVDQRTPSIPEEHLKTSHVVSSNTTKGKENNPIIDPKYLTQTAGQKIRQHTAPLKTQNRLNIPNGPRPPSTIPLMSAYFPPNDAVRQNGSK